MRVRVLPLVLTCVVSALLPACAADREARPVGDRPEPTTGSSITRRDRESDVKVMSREEYERARQSSGGGVAPPRN